MREDRSPGGKHRIKRPRPEELGIVDINKKMEDNHLELIEKLMEAGPERIPSSPNIGNIIYVNRPIITKTRPCYILQFFTTVKKIIFR